MPSLLTCCSPICWLVLLTGEYWKSHVEDSTLSTWISEWLPEVELPHFQPNKKLLHLTGMWERQCLYEITGVCLLYKVGCSNQPIVLNQKIILTANNSTGPPPRSILQSLNSLSIQNHFHNHLNQYLFLLSETHSIFNLPPRRGWPSPPEDWGLP